MPKQTRSRITRMSTRANANSNKPHKDTNLSKKATDKNKSSRKNPFHPTPPRTAYLFFADAKRKSVKEDHPEASFGKVAKLLNEQWKGLSDDEKKPYKEKAIADNARYEAEMKKK
ncbi:HMG-box [Lichtheimia hyalospora FSU 10163]|nr:HMG-box [Lichtheimia hyalospora FSU 10163]